MTNQTFAHSINSRLSVIICTFNRANLLGKCLQSLIEQSLSANQYEIIVVDNNSVDQTEEVTRKYQGISPNIRYMKEQKQGLSYSRNTGWQNTKCQYVAYIDDDAKASHDWCKKIVTAFQDVKPTPAAVGGKILPYYEKTPPKWFIDELEIRTWGNESHFLNKRYIKSGFSGSNMAFQRKYLEELDGFNTELGMIGNEIRMGEDSDFFFRLSKVYPFFWYDPSIIVHHYTPSEKFKINYIWQRGYSSGRDNAKFRGSYFLNGKYILGIVKLFYTIASVTFPTNYPGYLTQFKAKMIMKMREVAYRIGFLSVINK